MGTEKLEDTVKAFRHMGVKGFNLTMPDKTKMFGLCDRVSKAAEMIGAVNTVVNENGILVGHNTDDNNNIVHKKKLAFAGFFVRTGMGKYYKSRKLM